MQGVFSNTNDISLFLMIFPRITLDCKLVLVQYREYEYGQLDTQDVNFILDKGEGGGGKGGDREKDLITKRLWRGLGGRGMRWAVIRERGRGGGETFKGGGYFKVSHNVW